MKELIKENYFVARIVFTLSTMNVKIKRWQEKANWTENKKLDNQAPFLEIVKKKQFVKLPWGILVTQLKMLKKHSRLRTTPWPADEHMPELSQDRELSKKWEKSPKKVPNIMENQEQKRTEFCYQFNAPNFFKNVFLLDEFSFKLRRNTIKVWSCMPSHHLKKIQNFLQNYVLVSTEKMVFSPFYHNNETVNSINYQETLAQFIPFMLMDCTLMVGEWNKMEQHPTNRGRLETFCLKIRFKVCNLLLTPLICGSPRMCRRFSSITGRRRNWTSSEDMCGSLDSY